MKQEIIKAPVAWMLLKYKKVDAVGGAPYYFFPGCYDGFPVRFIAGWDAVDGGNNDEESGLGESREDKLQFIKLFNEFYPNGVRIAAK